MTMPAVLFTALGAVLTVPYVYLRAKRKLLPGLFFKIGVSVLFLLTAAAGLLAGGGAALRLGAAVFIGLAFGLLGDLFLDQKDMYAVHKDTYTFAGFAAFMAGHCFYITGMLSAYSPGWKVLLPRAAIALAAGAVCLLIAKPLKMNYGRFKWISVLYTIILTLMVSVAFASYRATGLLQPLLMGIGGVAFLFSDFILSQIYFCKGGERGVFYVLNYASYAAAQFCIALSLSV